MHPPKILQLPLSPPRHRWKGSRQRNAGIFLEESRVSGYSLLICHESYWMQELFAGRQIRYCITLALSASLSPHPYEVFRRQNRRTGDLGGSGASALPCASSRRSGGLGEHLPPAAGASWASEPGRRGASAAEPPSRRRSRSRRRRRRAPPLPSWAAAGARCRGVPSAGSPPRGTC